MWERYCRGVNAIVYMVDAADHDKIEVIFVLNLRGANALSHKMSYFTSLQKGKLYDIIFNFRHPGTSFTTFWRNLNWLVYQFWYWEISETFLMHWMKMV